MVNPVRDVYDQFRTQRMNIIYLEIIISRINNIKRFIDCSIALASSTSVAGIWLLQGQYGQIVWKLFIGFTAILSVLKPIFKFDEIIDRTTKQLIGYKSIHCDLEMVIFKINQSQKYTSELKIEFIRIMEKKYKLVVVEEPHHTDNKLLKKCFEQVKQELPYSKFYYPKGESHE